MTRRSFATAIPAAALAAAPAGRLPVKKGVLLPMLPAGLPLVERFKLAKAVGFDQMEVPTQDKEEDAQAMKQASEAAGLPIHSVMNMAHWKYPLSSDNPADVAEGVKGMQTSLRNAKLWGADTVLLVPAVVNKQVGYSDAWKRSTAQIRKLVPLAEELKVTIGVENVWNKFLLSPLEMANYVDQFRTPYVRAYFDVGNIVIHGYPQDWIRTLGGRIVKVHLKDFKFAKRIAEFTPLREGEIEWKEVHKALRETGYRGAATVELPKGDEAYLREVSRRVDLILNGE